MTESSTYQTLGIIQEHSILPMSTSKHSRALVWLHGTMRPNDTVSVYGALLRIAYALSLGLLSYGPIIMSALRRL